MRLRHTLAAIALAAPAPGCYPLGGGCPDPAPLYREGVPVGAVRLTPDPELDMLLAACRAQQSCEPLCAEVFERWHGIAPTGVLPECMLSIDPATTEEIVHYLAPSQCVGGRRPAAYRARRAPGTAVGAYLSGQAALEAASVRAFGDLLADLVALGAPAALRRAAIAAAGDEVRHAIACGQLAHRFGTTYTPPMVAAGRRRSTSELATDNLVEGCVRETYGAVIAQYQARVARDPAVRRSMHSIARDEAKHAALSWRLHGWLAPQLSSRERRDAVDAANAARAELHACPGTDDPELRGALGLPDAPAARQMLGALDATVWAAIAA